MSHHMYPFRVTGRPGDGLTVPLYPEECEPHSGPEIWDREFLARVIPTMDQRQCRGCGLWAIWEHRAITSNLKDGDTIWGPGVVYAGPPGAEPEDMKVLGTTDGFVNRGGRWK